ncbi:MAG: Mfa1 family fimbria major subunit [Candidatus Amulumruptor caecigallinarius]|nr:Mfa1 family fimbria major subunit [Candidatus Amulumruptor caecigallinarius]MCM1397192.1 Mfa1 family fimbria major subunit [Candidatus Amulumruptor caecigallinarius]MCM1453119.1 Mfa1 family fimbria major subunit [bacterium]
MKLTKYALMAAGCAMFAACSSDEPVQEAAAPNAPEAAGQDAGYVAFEIKLPTATGLGGRAAGDPVYDDGEAQEYAVINGNVIVFQNGATDADTKVVCTVPLTGMSWTDPNGGQNVTTSTTAVAKLSGVSVTGDETYSAVVVLNSDSNFPMPAVGDNFATWSTTPTDYPMIMEEGGQKYLTMTSAALLDGTTPKVLTNIDKTKIKATEAEALNAGQAASFYVQRAVAKVTTKVNASYAPTGKDYANDQVKILGWMCDITNKTSFPVQVTDGLTSDYAGIWSKSYFVGEGTPQRVYWGIDPNYKKVSETDAETAFNHFTTADLDNNGNPAKQYVLENTFDLDDQMTWETTRIIVRANYTPAGFNDGDTFYRISGDAKNYSKTGIEDAIKRQISILFSKTGSVDLGSAATTAGVYALNAFNVTIDGAAATTEQLNKIALGLGIVSSSEPGFSTYQSGIAYYQARIKHFGDELTPWQLGDPTYGTAYDKYLGRYGVVRNNSYEISINSISQPGSAVVPPIEPGPDDESTYYMSVTVNLLSWAKRVQNVDL